MAQTDEPQWITTNQAAEILGVAPRHVRRLIIAGELTGQMWGRDWMVDRATVQAYKERSAAKGNKRGPKPKDKN